MHRPAPRRRTLLPAYALLLSAPLTALTACSDSSSTQPPADAARPSTAATAPASSAPPRAGTPARPPVHVAIPSLGVDSAVMRLGLNADGTVEVPPAEKGMTVGWYTGGPVPGAPGPAVLIGHNDTRFGRAVFHNLKKIAQGADITVRDEKGATTHFTVTGRETVRKSAFPTARVYGPTKDRVLRLITCDGTFDAQGHPVDNLIVYAKRT
ncbi:class F sortase [Streptomyces sp. NPDC057682]|uniref:class F sortase n=1 Tax=Streptomyces sp. NPDC057682 TaxID=3346210 RepID=UPI0036AFB8E8